MLSTEEMIRLFQDDFLDATELDVSFFTFSIFLQIWYLDNALCDTLGRKYKPRKGTRFG